MFKRALAAAVVITAVFGAPAAAATDPVGKPSCVWIWTATGPACHWE